MEGNNRKLGWIAIGLGVLALVVALGGRGQRAAQYGYGPQFGYGPPAAVAPPQGYGPPQWAAPRGDASPGQRVGPQGGPGFQQGRPEQRGFGRGHFGPGFFFLPFILFGKLVKFALFLLVIALVARWFFRGRGRHGPSNGPGTEQPPYTSPGEQSRPGPEQPPYTGGTEQL